MLTGAAEAVSTNPGCGIIIHERPLRGPPPSTEGSAAAPGRGAGGRAAAAVGCGAGGWTAGPPGRGAGGRLGRTAAVGAVYARHVPRRAGVGCDPGPGLPDGPVPP